MSASYQVDPRGLRVAAGVTSAVLAAVLVSPSPLREALLAVQVAVFAIAVLFGLAASPYSALFRVAVRPRLGPPKQTEDSRPPRFAQLVGLLFTAGGLLSFVLGGSVAGLVLVAFALVAALLNAAVGLCLGCELYLVLRRLTSA